MSKGRALFLFLSLACLVPFLAATLILADDEEPDSLYKQLSVFSEVLSLVNRVYVEETAVVSLLGGALDGTTDALDPLSTFVPSSAAAAFEESRAVGTSRSGLQIAKDRGIAFAASVVANSPAAIAGVRPGDVVTRMNGDPTRPVPLWRLEELLTAEAGSEVKLDLLRQGQELAVSLTLAEFEVPSPSLEERRGIDVLRLERIDSAAVPVVRRMLQKLADEGSSRLVVDLLGAAGSDPAAAFELAGLFADGSLGELRGQGDPVEQFSGDAPPVWHGEVVALIDRGTSGAPEILATVLRQRVDARLVGEPSFGLAGRQKLIELSNGARLLLTDAFYAGPDGLPIAERLQPDVQVRAAGRSFSDEEKPLEETILERGVELLLEEEEPLRDVA